MAGIDFSSLITLSDDVIKTAKIWVFWWRYQNINDDPHFFSDRKLALTKGYPPVKNKEILLENGGVIPPQRPPHGTPNFLNIGRSVFGLLYKVVDLRMTKTNLFLFLLSKS